jgi:GntR family transcriptional regulator
MLRFNLDKKVKLSFYDQIKGQLLSAIYCGKIKEGDRLPSIRELAEENHVNYKTIQRVYLQLENHNYIDIVHGSGAFLKKRSGQNTYEMMRRRAIMNLLMEASEKSGKLGLSPAKFARLLESHATGLNLKRLRLAVVDHEEEAYIFSRELEARLLVDVIPVSLEKLEDDHSAQTLRASDYLLTTSWHMEDVAEAARRHGKEVVEIKPSHQIYMEILKNARDRKVAIVVKDERTMHASWDLFSNIFKPSTDKEFWIAPIDQEEVIGKIVLEADLIFVSPMCWDEMRKRAPADKELKTYENFISEETIGFLKELQLLT